MQGFQADLEAPDTDIALTAIRQHKHLLQIAKVVQVQLKDSLLWSWYRTECALPTAMLEGW